MVRLTPEGEIIPESAPALRLAAVVPPAASTTTARPAERADRSERGGAGVGTLLVLALLAGGGIVAVNASAHRPMPATQVAEQAAAPEPPQPQVPTVTPQDAAVQVVRAFYDAIGARALDRAYALMAPEWQAQLPYPAFSRGYADTLSSQFSDARVERAAPNEVVVTFVVTATERVQGRASPQRSTYRGTYTVRRSDGRWLITSGTLRLVHRE